MDESGIIKGIECLQNLQEHGQSKVTINGRSYEIGSLLSSLIIRDASAITLLSELHAQIAAEFMMGM